MKLMRSPFTGIGLCLLMQQFAAYGEVTGTCEHAFEAKFQPGGRMHMQIRSGDIEVTGADSPMIRVSCQLNEPERAKEITIAFTDKGALGDLRIRGGPNGDVRLRIELPKSSHLFLRSPAGDLTVSGMVGDKDIEIHAGDLTVSVGDSTDYKHADASVWVGDLSAPAFGVTKDGLFRSFNKDNPGGRYRLHAHVGAGDLVLR